MRKLLFMIIAAVLSSPFLGAQNFEYRWQRVHMDSTYESSTVYPVDRIVAEHEEQMAPLMKVVIYSNAEIQEDQPESALTNLVADMLIHAARPYIDNDYPTMSLTNMGGIRSNFPKGAVRVYDIYSTLPFNNSVVVAVMKGKDVREILENFAERERFEALGGVRIIVEDKEIENCLIGGQPLEEDGLYNLVTIDFLLDGSDRFHIGSEAVSIKRTGIVMRDAAVAYLQELSESGMVLENKTDGRVIIDED
jgi:2',3'-cyclic-nucleotide 2'-phosphodiesterase (5'-nucleotidase family)